MSSPYRRLYAFVCSLSTLLLIACSEPEITVTTVPKPDTGAEQGQSAAQSPMTPLPGMREDAAAAGTPQWQAPDHWQAQTGSSMRKGSWRVTDEAGAQADISVLAFPGDVGGDLANVNRWLQQINAPSISEEELSRMREAGARVTDGHEGFTVWLEGDEQFVYGAIIAVDGHTWFFKMMGAPAVVKQEREAFDTFLDTVQFP